MREIATQNARVVKLSFCIPSGYHPVNRPLRKAVSCLCIGASRDDIAGSATRIWFHSNTPGFSPFHSFVRQVQALDVKITTISKEDFVHGGRNTCRITDDQSISICVCIRPLKKNPKSPIVLNSAMAIFQLLCLRKSKFETSRSEGPPALWDNLRFSEGGLSL